LGKLRTVFGKKWQKLILPLIAYPDQFVTAVVTASRRILDGVTKPTI